jgi:alginate O-acetyltransferase complex protein AlgI
LAALGLLLGAAALRSLVPNWAFMWLMLAAIVGACKWLTYGQALRDMASVRVGRSIGYLFAWPGMEARRFLDPDVEAVRPRALEWLQACSKSIFGFGLIWIAVRLASSPHEMVAGWIGMAGVAFSLHFGLIHILSLAWRACGVAASHIFHSPLFARSVAEFWGRRWNLAFHEVVHSMVFRPLVGRLGVAAASLVTFAVSGVIHELVISLPAGAGYGLPTLYFLAQWLGVVLQRSRIGSRCGLRSGTVGWLFTLGVVLGPVALLFHPPFVLGVILPFLECGASSPR